MVSAKKSSLALLVAVSLFIACKKDKDTVPPVVTISSPPAGAAYNVLDLISVKAAVSDESKLEFVSIRLVNTGLQPVLPAVTLHPQEREYAVNQAYEVDDIHIETGTYYIRVRASDGTNETDAFAKVHLTGVPLARTGVLLVATPSASTVDVDLLSNSFGLSQFLFLSSDYAGSGASSYYQYLNICSNTGGALKSYRISDKAVQWSASTPGSFEGMRLDNELSYACYRTEAMVRGYDHLGGIKFEAECPTGFYPVKAWFHNNELFVQEQAVSGPGRRLSVYYSPSGSSSSKGVPNLPFTIAAAATMDDTRLLLFGNDATGQGDIYLLGTYGSPYFYSTPHFGFPAGTIYDAAAVNQDIYLIAHSSGIYLYRYSLNSVTLFAALPGAQAVAYDALHNEVLASDGAQVKVWDFPSTYAGNETVKATVPAANVRALHVLYNK